MATSSGPATLGDIDQATMMKHMKDLDQNTKVITDEGKDIDLGDDQITAKNTVFFKNCKNTTYRLNAYCTKVMIEGCSNCHFTFNARIITEVCELWKNEKTTMQINTPIKTLQLDSCNGLTDVTYMRKDDFDRVVWAGCEELHLQFEGMPQHTLKTTFAELKQAQSDLHEGTDQHIIRFVQGKLLQELVVRLENGFPTTEREAREYDRKQEAAAQAMAKEMGLTINRKQAEGPKVGRNDPCACGSGKKAKKCCQA